MQYRLGNIRCQGSKTQSFVDGDLAESFPRRNLNGVGYQAGIQQVLPITTASQCLEQRGVLSQRYCWRQNLERDGLGYAKDCIGRTRPVSILGSVDRSENAQLFLGSLGMTDAGGQPADGQITISDFSMA